MKNRPNYHFIGIGGAGMSAIAGVLLDMGHPVSGSDIKESRYTKALQKKGAKIFIGHSASNIDGSGVVVRSSAIPGSNVELTEAGKKNLKILQRAEMLAEIAAGKSLIAVAGTHGKTTTTSMISTIMEKCDCDPTYLIGAELNEIGANSRFGKGKFCVAEADESDGSMMFLSPEKLVITNIEEDHLEYYGSLSKIESTFKEFINNLPADGCVISCGDEQNIRDIIKETGKNNIFYGLNENNQIVAKNIEPSKTGSTFEIYKDGGLLTSVKLNVQGIHNIYNSLAAFTVGMLCGIDESRISKALSAFKGVKRRFEVIGSRNDITVVDDYAHHPSEIKATIQAAKNGEWSRIVTLFQPHRYSRTKHLYERFGESFDDADVIVLSDVYGAGEEPIPGITGKLIVDSLLCANPRKNVAYIPGKQDIVDYLASILKKGDLLLVMGAGDISGLCKEMLLKLDSTGLLVA